MRVVSAGGCHAKGNKETSYQKLDGEYLFDTSDIAKEVSEAVGQTEKAEDGKCSRAWIERDLRRDLLRLNYQSQ